MDNCIFCKIIKGQIPAEKVFEDSDVLVILDINPVTEGHALVIPKKHSTDLLGTSDHDAASALAILKKAARVIMEVVGAEGFNVHINNGQAAGQAVMHTHFHIIPRKNQDGLRLWTGSASDQGQRQVLAEKVKTAITNS